MVRAAFLDRDGVINRTLVRNGTPQPPMGLEELEILPGVAEALQNLRAAGLLLVVVTNQPDVARGAQTRARVEQINAMLHAQLQFDAMYVCYHDNPDRCACRKPQPGMLIQAAQEHAIDLASSYMVGDRWSDIVAGKAAGCSTILIDMPYSQRERCQPDLLVRDLADAASHIRMLLAQSADESLGA